jgi:hypothetical protein
MSQTQRRNWGDIVFPFSVPPLKVFVNSICRIHRSVRKQMKKKMTEERFYRGLTVNACLCLVLAGISLFAPLFYAGFHRAAMRHIAAGEMVKTEAAQLILDVADIGYYLLLPLLAAFFGTMTLIQLMMIRKRRVEMKKLTEPPPGN